MTNTGRPANGRNGADERAASIAKRKRRQAVWLRNTLHMTLDEIARSPLPCQDHAPYTRTGCPECGTTPMWSHRSDASKALRHAMEKAYPLDADHREQLRREAMATVDLAIRDAKRILIDAKNMPPDVRLRAAQQLTRLLERQARMLGLDAPARVTLTDDLDEQINEELAALTTALAQQDTGPTPLS